MYSCANGSTADSLENLHTPLSRTAQRRMCTRCRTDAVCTPGGCSITDVADSRKRNSQNTKYWCANGSTADSLENLNTPLSRTAHGSTADSLDNLFTLENQYTPLSRAGLKRMCTRDKTDAVCIPGGCSTSDVADSSGQEKFRTLRLVPCRDVLEATSRATGGRHNQK